jgi:hypothetical protein
LKRDLKSGAELERVNAELRQSLEKCRELLADCRSKLAANGNEPGRLNDTGGDGEAEAATARKDSGRAGQRGSQDSIRG